MGKDFNTRNIPDDLGKDFKTACAHFGLSMKAVIIKHMQNIVNDYRKERFMTQEPKPYVKRKGTK